MAVSVFANDLCNRREIQRDDPVTSQTAHLRKIITKHNFFLGVCGCSEFDTCIYFGGKRYEGTSLLTPISTIEKKTMLSCRSIWASLV